MKFPANIKNDFLAGITVSLALVPEAVAFAFVAKVDPLVGLYAAFIMGMVTALFGGRPGMISGATGAVAVVFIALMIETGGNLDYLFAAVIFCGVFQILFGLFGLGRFFRLVPEAVIYGFLNGLAIVIFQAQFEAFEVESMDASGNPIKVFMQGSDLHTMIGLVLLTMAIIHLLPKLTKAVPSSLVAIIVTTLVSINLFPSQTVGDLSSIAGGLPSFHNPLTGDILTLKAFKVYMPYGLAAGAVGLVESLITLAVVDEMTETRGRGNKECIALGAGNLLCGFFGGMGGCAMIGQSIININSGGRGRLSGVTAALGLLVFILWGSGLIEQIPMAALVGVMFMVVIGTFEWSTFRVIRRIPFADTFVIILVAVVTVFSNVANAVLLGVIVSALTFAWEKSKQMGVKVGVDSHGWKVYHLEGPLFFGSISVFKELFDPTNDPADVVIDFAESRVYGHAGLDAIDALAEKYKAAGTKLHLVHLSADCKQLLHKAGDLVEVNVMEDPAYHMAVSELS